MSRITSIASIILSIALAIILTVGSDNLSVANAVQYDKDGMPTGLTGDEFIIVRDTALSDPRVKELIDGKNYSITDCCGFLRPNGTAAWEPVINIRIANETQLGVRVNLDMQKVTALETGPVVTLGPRSNETAVSPDSSQIFPIVGIGAAIAGTIAFLTLRKRSK